MSFLYLPNRLNVAFSRAQCLFILVAAPKILEPEDLKQVASDDVLGGKLQDIDLATPRRTRKKNPR